MQCDDPKIMDNLASLKESPRISENLSVDGKDFLSKGFAINLCERWTVQRLLNHSFVPGVVGV